MSLLARRFAALSVLLLSLAMIAVVGSLDAVMGDTDR